MKCIKKISLILCVSPVFNTYPASMSTSLQRIGVANKAQIIVLGAAAAASLVLLHKVFSSDAQSDLRAIADKASMPLSNSAVFPSVIRTSVLPSKSSASAAVPAASELSAYMVALKLNADIPLAGAYDWIEVQPNHTFATFKQDCLVRLIVQHHLYDYNLAVENLDMKSRDGVILTAENFSELLKIKKGLIIDVNLVHKRTEPATSASAPSSASAASSSTVSSSPSAVVATEIFPQSWVGLAMPMSHREAGCLTAIVEENDTWNTFTQRVADAFALPLEHVQFTTTNKNYTIIRSIDDFICYIADCAHTAPRIIVKEIPAQQLSASLQELLLSDLLIKTINENQDQPRTAAAVPLTNYCAI